MVENLMNSATLTQCFRPWGGTGHGTGQGHVYGYMYLRSVSVHGEIRVTAQVKVTDMVTGSAYHLPQEKNHLRLINQSANCCKILLSKVWGTRCYFK